MIKIYEINESAYIKLCESKALNKNMQQVEMEDFFKQREEYHVENGIAYIDIFGPLVNDASEFEKETGITDYSDLEDELMLAANSADVIQVILSINSGGGESTGSTEICNIIENFPKPIYAVIDKGTCASAAYKIATACTAIYGTVSSEFGSVGSIIVIQNSKEMYNSMGVKNDIFNNQDAILKSIGQDFGDTTDIQKLYIQQKVEDSGKKFQAIVLKNRPSINTEIFDGRMVDANIALSYGMIDGII